MPRDLPRPVPRRDRRQHHQPHRHQRAQRLEGGQQVQHHQRHEDQVPRAPRAPTARGEGGVEAFQHQRPPGQREHAEGQRRRRPPSAAAPRRRRRARCRTGYASDPPRRRRQEMMRRRAPARPGRARRSSHPPARRWRATARRRRPPPPARPPARRAPAPAPTARRAGSRAPRPGSMPCASTSAVRLMRRSTRNTPSGGRGDATAPGSRPGRGAGSRTRRRGRSAVGEDCRGLPPGRRRGRRGSGRRRAARSQAAASSDQASAIARARSRFAGGQHLRRRAPGEPLARQQQRLGEFARDEVEVVQHGDDGPPLAMPARTSASRSAVVRASTALNGSSSRITGASCTSRRANSTRWNCPAERLPTGRCSKPSRPDGRQRLRRRARGRRAATARNAPSRRPEAHAARRRGRRPGSRGRSPPAAAAGRCGAPAASMRPRLRRVQAGEGAQQGGLAGAVRPDHGGQAAGREAAGEVMHRRPPVVADRQVAQADLGRAHARSAQNTPSHSSADSPAARTRRAPAPADRASGLGMML